MYFEIVLSHSRYTDSFIAANVIYSFTVVVVFNAVAIAVVVLLFCCGGLVVVVVSSSSIIYLVAEGA